MAAAPAAPEILVLADLLIGLAYLLTALVLMGVLWSYRNTFHWLFQTIGGWSLRVPVVGVRIHPLSILLDIDAAFIGALSDAASKQQKLAGRFFHAAAVVQGWIVRELKDFALETYGWAKWFQHVYLPTYIQGLHVVGHSIVTTEKVVTTKVKATTTTVERVVVQRIGLSRRQVKAMIAAAIAAAVGAAGTLPGLWPRIRDLEREAVHDAKRLRKLTWAGAFTSATALVVAALAKLGLNWIRCRNVKDAGRAVCRLDTGLLGELLTDGLLVFGTVSVVEFAKGLQEIEGEVIDVCSRLVREWPN